MKKTLVLIVAAALLLTCLASAEETASPVGTWIEMQPIGDSWLSLTLAEDGTGHLDTMPEELGTALSWSVSDAG